jgi:hypothetical protein
MRFPLVLVLASCLAGTTAAAAASPVAELGWKPIGKIAPRAAREIAASNWSIGCEVLDRDFARYSAYREYLALLRESRVSGRRRQELG